MAVAVPGAGGSHGCSVTKGHCTAPAAQQRSSRALPPCGVGSSFA